jgi:hypothetical protein
VGDNPRLLRPGRRRVSRRLVLLFALTGLVFAAPSSAAVALDINVTVFGTQGSGGWYRSNVTINWTYQGAERTEGCNAVTLTVDTPGTKVTCTAWNDTEGTSMSKTVTIKLDKTVPAVSTAPERLPDANGWYNRPLTVAFSGTDTTSGIATCSSIPYGGPDNPGASIVGSCTDVAGNANGAAFSFKYDATPPALFGVTATRGKRSAELAWRKSSDTARVEVWRAPGRNGAGESLVYQGGDAVFRDTGLVVGRKYEYRVAGLDDALNRSERKVDFIATGALLSPVPAERVTSPPQLVWTPVKGASYYNVQLIRGRKVFSAWPARPGLRLRRTWTLNGRRHRLRPGAYRWYVWPGYGRIKAARYGKLLGSSTFVVAG